MFPLISNPCAGSTRGLPPPADSKPWGRALTGSCLGKAGASPNVRLPRRTLLADPSLLIRLAGQLNVSGLAGSPTAGQRRLFLLGKHEGVRDWTEENGRRRQSSQRRGVPSYVLCLGEGCLDSYGPCGLWSEGAALWLEICYYGNEGLSRKSTVGLGELQLGSRTRIPAPASQPQRASGLSSLCPFSHLQMGMVTMDLPYRTAGKMK